MSKVKQTKSKIKSKLEAIKKINDDPKKGVDDLYDLYLKDLPSTDELFGKKLGGFLEKRKKKKDNKKDIFSEIIDTCESFLNVNKSVQGSDKLFSKNRIKKHANDSAKLTSESLKSIVLENIKKAFFIGDGICGTNKTIPSDLITIKPKEIDLTHMLSIDPLSPSGQIMYEPSSPNLNKQKVNRELYNSFNNPFYQFDTNNNKTLFVSTWNPSNQEFVITGLTQGGNVNAEDFLTDYFSSIEIPDIQGIIKTAMLMTIQGDGSESTLFNKGMNDLNRLLEKLFAICGSPKDNAKNQSPVDLLNENDENPEFYFDFNDVEGIDLDDEDARNRRVLRFKDCNNFEIPSNKNHIEDFVYLLKNKSLNNVVDSTLLKTAKDAHEQSDGLTLENLHLSLVNLFILKLPKALISSVINPKIFLPIVILYKLFKSQLAKIDLKDLMKKLSKMFFGIIKDIFWKFIIEFWRLIKKDLLAYVQKLIAKILKNKYKRYIRIIKSLISFLQKILENGIDNCADIFNLILSTINSAISGGVGIPIPGLLLLFADQLPGYSEDRAVLNIKERMYARGIDLLPINGEENDFGGSINDIINGHTEEVDTNSFIEIVLKSGVLPPTPTGLGATVIPGIIKGCGKWK
jgi:hypothetical protein